MNGQLSASSLENLWTHVSAYKFGQIDMIKHNT